MRCIISKLLKSGEALPLVLHVVACLLSYYLWNRLSNILLLTTLLLVASYLALPECSYASG